LTFIAVTIRTGWFGGIAVGACSSLR